MRSTYYLRSRAVGIKGQIVLIEQCHESICCGFRTEEGIRPGLRLRARAGGEEFLDVVEVEAGGGLVEDEEDGLVGLAGASGRRGSG